MLKRITVLALALVMVFALAACNNDNNQETDPVDTSDPATTTPDTTSGETEPLPEGEKVFVFGQRGVKAVLDRTIVTYIQTGQITNQLYESLLYINPFTGEMEPRLAVDFAEVSEDNLQYTFKLKEGVKWHDGTDFTADDVLFSFERIFTPATGSLVVEDFVMIVGAQDMLDGKADTVSGIEVLDDYTIRFTIEEPFALFETNAGADMPIYPRKACTEAGEDWGLGTAIGTGPFMLESHNIDTGARLVRFEDYHGKKPNINVIEFKFYDDDNTMLLEYEAGNIDSMMLDAAFVDQYQNDPTFASHLQYHPTYGHFFVIMNFNMEPWTNPKVREAFSYAIDVDSIANDLFDGLYLPAACLIGPGMMGHDESVPVKQYDPEKAKELLTEAGYPEGVEVEFISTNLEGAGGKMIIAMQSTAGAAGFTITPKQVDSGVWTDIRNNGQVQTFIGNWYLGIPDADGLVYGFFHSSNNKFFSSMYVSEEYDTLVETARTTLDDADRAELYRQADEILISKDFVTVPIAWPVQFYLQQPWLVGYEMQNSTSNFDTFDIDLSLQPGR